MELLMYIAIMVVMGVIGYICRQLDPWGDTPFDMVGGVANVIFAIMFLLLVAGGIFVIFGVEVGA